MITEQQRRARQRNIRIAQVAYGSRQEEGNPRWRGGSYVAADGYRYVRIACEHGRTHYRLEHRLIVEEALGRRLDRFEHVHHRNGIKTDNRLANLQVLSVAEHGRIHGHAGGRARHGFDP